MRKFLFDMKKILFFFSVILLLSSCQQKFETWQNLNEAWLENHKSELGKGPYVDSTFIMSTGTQCEVYFKGFGPKPHSGYDLTGSNPNSYVLLKYTGELIDGTEFGNSDSTWMYVVSMVNGMQNAICQMHEGAHFKVYIPWDQGYGSDGLTDSYSNFTVPPYSTLIFDVEIRRVINQ